MTKIRNSRLEKFEKRRRNTKYIYYSIILAIILVLFLVGNWIFGGGNKEVVSEPDQPSAQETTDEIPEDMEVEEQLEGEETTSEDMEALETEEVIVLDESEYSDDNVKAAVTGNWPPIGTSQTGPHDTTDFNEGSLDRLEIRKAVSYVTGIPEEHLMEWWIGNGGHQKVIATVSERTEGETETYRVFLTWIDGEGWQPTKVETLIENEYAE